MSLWTIIKRKTERMQDIYAAVAFAEAGELEKARLIDFEQRLRAADEKKALRRGIALRRTDRPTLR